MLFDFFNKHERQNDVRKHLGRFQDEFTDDQKKAVLFSLLMIANSDGEYHRKEEQFFEQACTTLGFHIDAQGRYLDEFSAMGRDRLFQLLASLDEGQKDWYIFTAIGMMTADGQALEAESQYIYVFFEQMGITKQRIENVMRKMNAMMR